MAEIRPENGSDAMKTLLLSLVRQKSDRLRFVRIADVHENRKATCYATFECITLVGLSLFFDNQLVHYRTTSLRRLLSVRRAL